MGLDAFFFASLGLDVVVLLLLLPSRLAGILSLYGGRLPKTIDYYYYPSAVTINGNLAPAPSREQLTMLSYIHLYNTGRGCMRCLSRGAARWSVGRLIRGRERERSLSRPVDWYPHTYVVHPTFWFLTLLVCATGVLSLLLYRYCTTVHWRRLVLRRKYCERKENTKN